MKGLKTNKMKFLIQKIDREIRHDFSFTLMESIRYLNWSSGHDDVKVKYINYIDFDKENWNWYFKPFHQDYVPVGSVEFVLSWMKRFDVPTPKPLNVPEELFKFTNRTIWNADENGFHKEYGKLFIKSNDKIKSTCGVINEGELSLPKGNYQFSEEIEIDSEWRAFVYNGKLVGLQNYSGDFTMFPSVVEIENMIDSHKTAPVAYTLDVGIFDEQTFVIEVHPMVSVGLYGFSDHRILPFMFARCHYEYLNNLKN